MCSFRSANNYFRIACVSDSVDDAPFIVTMAKRMLEKMGHIVESASNGSLGLNRLSEVLGTDADFDLVLCDFQMPVMDGFEAMRRYRAFERESKAAAADQRTRLKSSSSAGAFADAILSSQTQGHLLADAARAFDCERKDMAIVGMSANSDLGSQTLAREAGMNAFVPKPFSQANLGDILILFR